MPTPWESVLPNLLAVDAPMAADMPMDSEAFAGFYCRSARPLWAYLARVSGDPALADDLMQESYVRYLCASHPVSFAGDGEVAARRYLFRIATNLLRDHWRRPRSTSIEDLPEDFFAATATSAQADSQAILGPALAQMRPRDRQLLWLAHAEGYSHREIAEVTGLATAGIRLLLFRARHKIARLLKNQNRPVLNPPRKLNTSPDTMLGALQATLTNSSPLPGDRREP
jgi:RNA polymerase sigma-70 factor (ECF subfamily)